MPGASVCAFALILDLADPLQLDVIEGLSRAGEGQPKEAKRGERPLLEAKVFDDRQNPMVAVHTTRGAKRYRYYLSRPKITGKGQAGSLHRISAGMLEHYLTVQLAPRLAAGWCPDLSADLRVAGALKRVTLSDDRIEVRIASNALRPQAVADVGTESDGDTCLLRLAFEMRRRQGALILQAPGFHLTSAPFMDRALIRAIVMARTWSRQLETGEVASIKALARREGLCDHYTSRLLPLAYLAPDLTDDILNGRQHRAVSLASLTAAALPLSWLKQRLLVEGLGAAGA